MVVELTHKQGQLRNVCCYYSMNVYFSLFNFIVLNLSFQAQISYVSSHHNLNRADCHMSLPHIKFVSGSDVLLS